VLSEKGPVEDSRAYAYVDFQDIKDKSPSYVSVPGDKKGFYKLELPPGEYYLTASGTNNGNEYYSYHGANPITVEDRKLWIPFMALPTKVGLIKDSSSTRLSGNVTFKGKPVQNAQVSIYPLFDKTFRGMGFLTNTTNNEGFFSLSPEPGEYVIVARKRKNFKGLRPLKKGDLFCYFAANPVLVRASKETLIEISCYPKNNLQEFLDEDVYATILVKKSGEDSIRFRERKIENSETLLKIKGRVTDLQGNPMKDIYVKAYKGNSSHMFKMLYIRTMPEYMVKTDEHGHYIINVDEKGTYHIIARELIGEAPAKGEYYGLYEDNVNHAVVLEKDSIGSINIVVSRIMTDGESQESEVISQKSEEKKQNREYIRTVKVKNRLYNKDTVINMDTEWSGYVVISGTVHVARSATLTISPGTTVLFRRLQRKTPRIKWTGHMCFFSHQEMKML
jgi:hypothetical protein